MKKIELDLRCIHTPAAAHIYMQYMLNLPEYYGRNLDALYDVLARDLCEDTRIELRLPAEPDEKMAKFIRGLERALEDAAQENEHLKFGMTEA